MPEHFPAGANFPKQLETLERLRDALEQTQALYESAKEVVLAENSRRAIDLRDFLFTNYRRALSEFTRFILDRKAA